MVIGGKVSPEYKPKGYTLEEEKADFE